MMTDHKRLLFLSVLVLGPVSLILLFRSNEGIRRSIYFWWGIFPVYLNYRFIQLLKRDLRLISHETGERLYNDTHNRFADVVKDLHYALRGYYLKNAQVLSTQAGMLPQAYMKWMTLTQDSVPSEFPPNKAREYTAKLMRDEMGLDFDEVFDFWEEKPLGIASIGEVHLCRLRKSQQYVALKIQFENIEQRFRSDMRTLKAFCAFAMPQHLSGFDEVEKNFDSEFDYTLEARNLNEVRDIILPKWGNKVYIPRPYLEYTSKHVLVMEFLNGTSLMKGLQQHFTALAELMNINIEELEAQKELMMRNNSFPYRSLEEEKQLGRKLRRASWIRGLVKGRPQRSSSFSSKWGSDFLDLAYIVKTLFQEHASEMFDAGACNTDCHPGNVLLMHDGRLGLLDYGQVKRMELSHRISFARMIMAIARDDREEILRLHFDEIGVKTKYRNETIGYLASAFYYDRDTPDILGDKDVVNFMEYIEAQDPMVQLPEPFIMAWKGNAILRGVAKILGIQVRTSQVWRNQAASFLKAHGF